MIQRQSLLPSMSQRCGCPDGVLDLSTIDVPRRKLPNFLRSERHADLGQERVPNLRLGRSIQVVEVKGDVNTRAEGIIDDLDPVRREEEDTAIVLEVTKAKSAGEFVSGEGLANDESDSQDCDHCIPNEVME